MRTIGGKADKKVQARLAAAGTDPKHGAVVVRPAVKRCPVEIAVAALDELCAWISPIAGQADKGVKIRLRLSLGIERSTRQDQQNNSNNEAACSCRRQTDPNPFVHTQRLSVEQTSILPWQVEPFRLTNNPPPPSICHVWRVDPLSPLSLRTNLSVADGSTSKCVATYQGGWGVYLTAT